MGGLFKVPWSEVLQVGYAVPHSLRWGKTCRGKIKIHVKPLWEIIYIYEYDKTMEKKSVALNSVISVYITSSVVL